MTDEEKIATIEVNRVSIMTKELHHLFLVNGCNPTCHCCHMSIPIGGEYKLGSVTEENILQAIDLPGNKLFSSNEPHDVMLCGNRKCTPFNMIIRKKQLLARYKKEGKSSYGNTVRVGGCSIVNGKIVI